MLISSWATPNVNISDTSSKRYNVKAKKVMSNTEDARQNTFCCSFSTCLKISSNFDCSQRRWLYLKSTYSEHEKGFTWRVFITIFSLSFCVWREHSTNHAWVFDVHKTLYPPLHSHFSIYPAFATIPYVILDIYYGTCTHVPHSVYFERKVLNINSCFADSSRLQW